MTSIARARRGFEGLGNEYEVRGGTSIAANAGANCSYSRGRGRVRSTSGTAKARWHQAERASRCKRKKYVLVIRVPQLVYGSPRRARCHQRGGEVGQSSQDGWAIFGYKLLAWAVAWAGKEGYGAAGAFLCRRGLFRVSGGHSRLGFGLDLMSRSAYSH